MEKLLRTLFCLSAVVFIGSSSFAQKDAFGLDSVQTKLVDNRGAGPDSLFGVRNMRVVLNNVLYRGGSNNFHRKESEPKTYNSHPLPYWGIDNLRKSGFGGAIYLYSKYFTQDYPQDKIDSLAALGFNYQCLPSLNEQVVKSIFTDINKRIYSKESAPIYIHCWNGWHQSGMLSAYTLMQFCGISNQQALKYWEQNTDGNYKGFPAVKTKILEFKPYQEFKTDSLTRLRICPCFTESVLNVKEIEKISEIQKEGDSGQKEMMENRSESKDEQKPKDSAIKKYHTVKSGDTLSKIAAKNKTTVSKLCKLNGIKESKVLRIGDKIRVR